MRETVTLHVGQVGCEVAGPLWSQLAAEHGISATDGTRDPAAGPELGDPSFVFAETAQGRYVPRALVVDTDPGMLRSAATEDDGWNYFGPANIVTNSAGASGRSNFAVAYYLESKQSDDALSALRRQLEVCDSPEAIVVHRSTCGGTGSGLTGRIMNDAKAVVGNTPLVAFSTVPCRDAITVGVEAYNAVLCFSGAHGPEWDLHVLSQSNTVARALSGSLHHGTTAGDPSYRDINGVIASVASSHTALRRHEATNATSSAVSTADVIDSLRSAGPAGSPLVVPSFARHQQHHNDSSQVASALVDSLAAPDSALLAESGPRHDDVKKPAPDDERREAAGASARRILGAWITFRGLPLDVAAARAGAARLNDAVQGLEPSATCLYALRAPSQTRAWGCVDSSSKEREALPATASMLSRSSVIGSYLSQLAHDFDLMYSKRAYVHWYVGLGLTEGLFSEGREELAVAEQDWGALQQQQS